MSILEAKTNTYLVLGSSLLFTVLFAIFSQNFVTTGLLLIILFWGILALALPKTGLFLIIFLRPLLDLWTSLGILKISEKELNLAAILSLILLSVTGLIAGKNQKELKRLPLSIPWLGFILVSILSVFWSVSTFESLAESLRLFSILAIFIYAYAYTNKELDFEKLLNVTIVSGIIPSLLAIQQYLTNTGLTVPFEGIYNRIYGTFAHPNLLAYYLLLPIISSLYFVIKSKSNQIKQLTYSAISFAYVIILIMTFTRGAWLALFIVIGTLGFLRYRVLLVASLFTLLIAYGLITPIQSRINDLLNNPYSSIDWRQDLWNDAKNYATEKPLLGQGAGVAKTFIADKRGPQFGSSDPHNDYLKILLETGLVGLTFYLSVIISLLWLLIKKIKASNATDADYIILGTTIALFSLSFADNILRNTALNWTYWALIGAYLKVSIKKQTRLN